MNAPNVGENTYTTMWLGQEDWILDTPVDVPMNHLPQKPPRPEPRPPIRTHLSSTNPVDYVEPTHLIQENSAWNTNALTAIFTHQNINLKPANDDLESQNASPKEEPRSPTPFNWDHEGYYEIEGYEDGNLNGEN